MKKSGIILIATAALVALYVMRCTGAVAPKQEGGTLQSTDTAASTATKTTTTTTTATTTTTTTTTASSTDTETTATALGDINETTNELTDFDPKSAYGVYNTSPAKSLSIVISESALTEDDLKVVKSYTCTACNGANDTNCPTGTTTVDQISISFSATGSSVDANAFPNADALTKTGLTDGKGFSMTFGTQVDNTGTITFASGGRPASATDDFDFDLKFVHKDGKKYDAVIKGKIITFPTQTATKPTCATGEYAKPSY